MSSLLLVAAGIFIRTLLLIGSAISWKDIRNLGLALLCGLYAAGKLENGIGLPLGIIVVLAFFYKDKIISSLTEGTLLLYGLIALFVYTATPNHFFSDLFVTWYVVPLLILYTLVTLFLCVTKMRVPFTGQVILVVCFLAVNVYVSYQTGMYVLLTDTTLIGQLLIGFYGLHFCSHILYILDSNPNCTLSCRHVHPAKSL